ncbi:retrotransposon protein, putative, ty1-copia subclass [Tanacetum coccineum]
MLQDVKSYLGRCFAMKDLGEAAYIIGIKIYRDRSRRLIGLCQSAYIEKILKRFHMENSKRESIPMQEKLRLSKSQGASTPVELKHMQNVPYASVVGDLHWTTVKNILKYLRNTKDMFLVYGGDIKRELRVSCYTDIGYLTDTDDLKSQTGYVFILNGGDVDWKSTKQSIFATSSAEAEYIAAYDASKEAVWVRKFISGLGVVPIIEEPINMYCDNTGSITIANESGITKGARHFHAKVHYLREVIEYGDIKDLGEPANYKAALLDPESYKWLNAMNVEMQSMKDNEVWDLVDLPPNGKTIGSKWLFKKKTDMDGAVHTYKARLVVKGFTQTYRVDYEETFSHVADIKAIRILVAIAAYYDYEIWQMDVKTTFLNGHLSEEVYMEQHEGFVNPKYPNRVCKLKHSIYRLKQPSRQWNKRFDDEIKKFGFTQNRDEPCVYLKASESNITFLILYVDDILIMGNNIPMLQDIKSYLRRYLTDADDLKSQNGYVFVLNGGAVDWKRTKQSIFATSSAEAEYTAAYDASKEAVWVKKIISGLGIVLTIEEPINMYCDNTRAIVIANESGITKGARYFCAKVHYLRDVIEYGDIKREKVHTNDNLADPFTKALAFPKHSEHILRILECFHLVVSSKNCVLLVDWKN